MGAKQMTDWGFVYKSYNGLLDSKFHNDCEFAKNELQSIYEDYYRLVSSLHLELCMEIKDYKLAQSGVKIR